MRFGFFPFRLVRVDHDGAGAHHEGDQRRSEHAEDSEPWRDLGFMTAELFNFENGLDVGCHVLRVPIITRPSDNGFPGWIEDVNDGRVPNRVLLIHFKHAGKAVITAPRISVVAHAVLALTRPHVPAVAVADGRVCTPAYRGRERGSVDRGRCPSDVFGFCKVVHADF